jgi:hypothetical protein
MKAINIIFLFVMCGIPPAYCQQFFSNVALADAHEHKMICFTLPKEVNVMYYRVEAGNDTNDLDIIGRVTSSGNSMLPKSYHYDLFAPEYKYYRIGIAGMDGSLHYSKLISANEGVPDIEPIFKPAATSMNNDIANLR